MSKHARHSALCDAYDEYIQDYSDRRLDARRDVLRRRALRKRRRPRSPSREDLEKELVAIGRKQLNGFLPPANVPRRYQTFTGRADYSHRNMHVLGNVQTSPDGKQAPQFTWGQSSSRQQDIPKHDWDTASNGAGAQDKK